MDGRKEVTDTRAGKHFAILYKDYFRGSIYMEHLKEAYGRSIYRDHIAYKEFSAPLIHCIGRVRKRAIDGQW